MFKRFAIILALSNCGQALAEVPYIDNRSTASDVVTSLYNAINRKEYARAWSYFSEAPAKNFEDYAKGYDSTESVELEVGFVGSEGAAGSIYYTVPVAIRSRDKSTEERVFAGCYTVRQVNASIQDPPFRPLMIEKGKLKSVELGELVDLLPDCGIAPIQQADIDKAKAISLFKASFAQECISASAMNEEPLAPEVYDIRFRYDYQTADEPEQKVTIFNFPCTLYAYNFSNVYYIKSQSAELELLTFASPNVKSSVEGEENQVLKSIAIDGFNAQTLLINSEFNSTDNSITFFAKGRGIGDISSSGTYKFREGNFVLTDYAHDATGNGEIDPVDLIVNGKTVEPKF